MAADPLNRKMSMVAAFFAFMGVILGVIALATNYWTIETVAPSSMAIQTPNGTILMNENIHWNGLFYNCSTRGTIQCFSSFWPTTFILCLIGLMFLLVGGILLCWDMFKMWDRRFITPMLFFVGCVLMTAGLFDYGSWSRMNSHSSRTMMASIVFAYTALPMAAFIAGRYSTLDRFTTNGHATNGQKYVPTSTNGN